MTLPTTGNLTFAMIKAEFNKPNATSLRDFLGETASPNNLPSSGIIKMSDFRGLSAPRTFTITLATRDDVTTDSLWTEFFPNDHPTEVDTVVVEIPSGVTVGASSTSAHAFTHNVVFSSPPAHFYLNLQGVILGGDGGTSAGGPALYVYGGATAIPLLEVQGAGTLHGGAGSPQGPAVVSDGGVNYTIAASVTVSGAITAA